MKIQHLIPILFLAAFCTVSAQTTNTQSEAGGAHSSRMTTDLVLHGTSSGGNLTFTKAAFSTRPYVIVTNEPGLSAGAVISRLADQLTASKACIEHWGKPQINEETLSVGAAFSPIILGGTETGFGIPQPPTSVSVRRDTNGFTVFWENPPGGYDKIAVIRKGELLDRLPGDATHWIIPTNHLTITGPSGPTSEDAFMVVGYRSGTPSNGAGVRATEDYRQQDSQMNVPFTMNVAPGFQAWQEAKGANAVVFEQGTLEGYGMGPGEERYPIVSDKFYQILKGQGNFHGGVSRRFIGLFPGHTYHVAAAITTPLNPAGDWSFSFHAAYNPPTGEDLTPAQMAGDAELPDKTKGPNAGLIAKIDAKEYTHAAWPASSKRNVDEIVLPDNGVDSITVWVRLDGTGAPAVSGQLHSVIIEDLGKK